jgi:hypothetical protein
MKLSAIISDCERYRYRLDRDLERAGKTAAFIMVNPSTADMTKDDATIRKLIGFSDRLGFGKFIVGNLFAYRATDVKALATAHDPIGPDNDAWLGRIFVDADIHIVAWGPVAKLPRGLMRRRWQDINRMARMAGVPLHCLGTAQDGHPRHPLMLAYSAALQPWDYACAASS